MLNVLSQLVTYKILSASATEGKERQRQTFYFVYFVQHLMKSDYKPKSARRNLFRVRHILKSCRILSVDALPSKQVLRTISVKQSRRHPSPSITIFILPTRPCTTPSVCATVIRASSWVNRSNRWSMASISPSPNNFFANFSVEH